MSAWYCLDPDCGDGGTGDHDEVQRAADRHTQRPPHHPTGTSMTGWTPKENDAP